MVLFVAMAGTMGVPAAGDLGTGDLDYGQIGAAPTPALAYDQRVRRRFNTAGLCIEGQHYMVPPIPRLPEAGPLIEQGAYFVVHAPRQTGKSTTLRAICRKLTAEGQHAAVDFSCETAEVARDDFGHAERLVLSRLAAAARDDLPDELQPPDPWPDATPALGSPRGCAPGLPPARARSCWSSTRSTRCRARASRACCGSSATCTAAARSRGHSR